MASKPKKLPFKVGDEVWVRAKVTRLAPHPRLPEITDITVQLNGQHITMGLNEDIVRPVENA